MKELARRRFGIACLTLILAVMLIGLGQWAQAADKIEIKFSHVVAEPTPKGQAALKLKELLEKTGYFEVKVYPSSQLYGDKEELEALIANNVQLIAPSSTKLVGFSPAFQLVDMPFLFSSDEAVYKFQESPEGEKLLHSLRPKGFIGLAWWTSGAKHFSNNKHPLKTPDDFKGLKFRSQSGGVLDAQFKALGAGSQTMAFGEVYQALNSHAIDGQENTFNNFDSQKYQEVQNYLTLSAHGRLEYVVLTNTTFWDSLTPEQQKALKTAIAEATQYERKLADELNDKSLENIKNSGKVEIYSLTAEERTQFVKAMQPVYDTYTKKIGEEYINAAKSSN